MIAVVWDRILHAFGRALDAYEESARQKSFRAEALALALGQRDRFEALGDRSSSEFWGAVAEDIKHNR